MNNHMPTHSNNTHKFSVAPMMDWTDRQCRVFHRLLTRRALLYTEMVTTGAILHGDRARHLDFDAAEHPVALQLGGSDPAALAACTRIAADWGYGEVNLNIGCPSDRVQDGRFGACLMADPALVGDCLAAMIAAAAVPVTAKCRLGIDHQQPEDTLPRFLETVRAAGCRTVIIHARKAWLHGLSPKQNRDVPPLDYDLVYRMKQAFPDLTVVINGGIPDLAAAAAHLRHVDGVMLGRSAYQAPWRLARVDSRLFGVADPMPDRDAVIEAFIPHVEQALARGVRLAAITRHIMGLYQGQPGARLFRRHLSEQAPKPGAGIAVLRAAVDQMRRAGGSLAA